MEHKIILPSICCKQEEDFNCLCNATNNECTSNCKNRESTKRTGSTTTIPTPTTVTAVVTIKEQKLLTCVFEHCKVNSLKNLKTFFFFDSKFDFFFC